MEESDDDRARGRRLGSWKSIAAHFGRDERTVKRWEVQRGMPVRRVPGGGKATVYAYVGELEAWLADTEAKDSSSPNSEIAPVIADLAAQPVSLPSHRRPIESYHLVIAALMMIAVGSVAGAAMWFRAETSAPRPVNAAAYSYYLKGLYSWQTRTPAGLAQAIDDFNRSIAADPNFASAYVGLADCYNLMREYTSMPAAIAYPRAKAAAQRAIALDDDLASAHLSLAFVEFWWDHDLPNAMPQFDKALQLGPRSAEAHLWYANALGVSGDLKRALAEVQDAESISPGSSAIMADEAMILNGLGRTNEGVQILKQIETAQPQFIPAHDYLALFYREKHDARAMLHEMRSSAELKHDATALSIVEVGENGLSSGGFDQVMQGLILKEQGLYDQGHYSPYLLAVMYALVKEKQPAMALLERAVSVNDPNAMAIRADEALIWLHGDARFQHLVTREGLPPLANS